MEYPIKEAGRTLGTCVLEDRGLYWRLEARCRLSTDRVEKLWAGDRALGVLAPDREIALGKTVSKKSSPWLPPERGYFTLEPEQDLVFPYDPALPCPVEPLLCLFTIRDGQWVLPGEYEALWNRDRERMQKE